MAEIAANVDAAGQSLMKVIDFLRQRHVKRDVLKIFEENHMDEDAVRCASAKDFTDLGLTEKGHIVALKSFCMNNDTESRKKELVETLKLSGKERASRTQKTITFGWKHYNLLKNKFCNVRDTNGGGVHKKTFPYNTNGETLIDFFKSKYFPNGKNYFAGQLNTLNCSLGTNDGESIDIIDDEPFTLMKFFGKYNHHANTRLYLLTKKKKFCELVDNVCSIDVSDDNGDDDFMEPFSKIKCLKNEDVEDSTKTLNLIGTSKERVVLQDEIRAAYDASLKADQEKQKQVQEDEANQLMEQSLEEEERNTETEKRMQEVNRLEKLRVERTNRMQPEPALDEAHVPVTIRHPSEGSKVRLFSENAPFQQVYDWVGSIALRPEFYDLRDHTKVISPDKTVYSAVFNVHELDEPVWMSPSGSVAFTGFGVKSTESSNLDKNENYKTLTLFREDECKKFADKFFTMVVDRDNIFNDMIEQYSKRITCTQHVHIKFSGENGVGDGVSRDAFSAFFESMYKEMEGSFTKVPTSTVEESTLETIGKIISHAFILYDIFPVGLSKSSLKHYLFGSVSDEELLFDFMQYITPVERDLIESYASENQQAILDILCEYSIFDSVNVTNVKMLMTKAAKVALIRMPCFSIQAIIKGMGNFWQKITEDMFDALYICATPTTENVLKNIEANETSRLDQRITTWLHRYIRSCDQDKLVRFIRFITGSETFPPETIIRVEFTNLPVKHLRPSTKTCFKILILPRQYTSFYHLKENIDFYISNSVNWSVHDVIVPEDTD